MSFDDNIPQHRASLHEQIEAIQAKKDELVLKATADIDRELEEAQEEVERLETEFSIARDDVEETDEWIELDDQESALRDELSRLQKYERDKGEGVDEATP